MWFIAENPVRQLACGLTPQLKSPQRQTPAPKSKFPFVSDVIGPGKSKLSGSLISLVTVPILILSNAHGNGVGFCLRFWSDAGDAPYFLPSSGSHSTLNCEVITILVEFSGVEFGYGSNPVLEAADLRLDRGEVVGLLGLNGSGKTTTMRLIASILDPVAGVLRRGYNRLGYLPEERGLYRRLTVSRYLRFVGEINLLTGRDLAERVADVIDRLQLRIYQSQRIESLSKGNQQKVQLAATLVPKPDLMLWDEPFSGLDALNRDLLLEVLRDLRHQGVTVLLSTHRLEDLELLADRTYILAHRRFVEYVAPGRPERYQVRFMGDSGEYCLDADAHMLSQVIEERTRAGQAVLAVAPRSGLEAIFRRLLDEERSL